MNDTIRVANALDAGLIPWRLLSFPHNVDSRKPYVGLDPILLQMASTGLGFSSSWWGTAREWQRVGCKVQDALGVRIPSCPDPVHNLDQTDCQPPKPPQEDP